MNQKSQSPKNTSGNIHRRGPAAIGVPAEKAKDFKGTLRRLIVYLSPYKIAIVFSFVLAIIGTLFGVVAPRILGRATDSIYLVVMERIQGNNIPMDYGYLQEILIMLAGVYLINAVMTYLMQRIMVSISQKTVYGLREQVNDKLTKLPLKYFDNHSHGEILSRVTNDIDNVSNTLQQSLNQMLTSVVSLIGIFIMMLRINLLLTLVTLITLPLSILITKNIAKQSQKQFKAQQKSLGELNGHIEEMFTGHRIVKAYNYEDKSQSKFDSFNEELYDSSSKAQFISGMIMPLMTFVGNVGYVIVAALGSIFVTRQVLSLGDIQAFIQYTRNFSQPIVQIANIANIIQSTIASAERVFEILDEEEEWDQPSTCSGKVVQGQVQFNKVKFYYEENRPLIENLDIRVKGGQTVAIVGPTGAGKTTLVNLLMRFYDIIEGSIYIDDCDVHQLSRGDVRSMFGMVLQDTWLFKGTLLDNIAYGKENAAEYEVIEASKNAYADDFIRRLPEGYQTELNEEADNISQGQKQLITIARALLADPQILILDEATSSVDTLTEKLIQKATQKLMKGRTSFVIAHRLSTIVDADLILVMNEGQIIEQGTHQQLLKKQGFYYDLYNSQFAMGIVS